MESKNIPELKSSEHAIEYGKSIKNNGRVYFMLLMARKYALLQYKNLSSANKINEAMKMAVKAQLYREAAEACMEAFEADKKGGDSSVMGAAVKHPVESASRPVVHRPGRLAEIKREGKKQ